MVNKGIENRSALKIVDTLIRSEIPKDEYAKFIDNILHDLELKEIIAERMVEG